MEDSCEMRDFIEFYKRMPELWNSKNESYKNRNTRNVSYKKLLTEYKKIKNDGTIEELKKKIANMRTCYRRELKKVLKSHKSGSGANDIYVSNLWYYDAFEFLRDLEMPVPGRSNISDDDEENVSINEGKTEVSKKASVADARVNFLKRAAEHLENSAKQTKIEDEAAAYGNGWAFMFRQMNPDQQMFAKRAIDEILMLGRLNQLTYNTVHSVINGSGISSPYNSRGSSTPVVFSDDSVQYIQTEVLPRRMQTYAYVASEPQTANSSESYSGFAELLNDSQYQ